MKRTLKRELKVREIVKREALETSVAVRKSVVPQGGALFVSRVSIGLAWSKKPWEGSPLLGVIAHGHALDWTEDRSCVIGYPAASDCPALDNLLTSTDANEPGGLATPQLRMLTKWF